LRTRRRRRELNRENDDLFAGPRKQPAGRDVRAYLADTKNKRAAAAATADKNKLRRASGAKFCQQRNGIMALAPPTKTNKMPKEAGERESGGESDVQRATRIICQKLHAGTKRSRRSWQSGKTYPSDTLPSSQPLTSSRSSTAIGRINTRTHRIGGFLSLYRESFSSSGDGGIFVAGTTHSISITEI